MTVIMAGGRGERMGRGVKSVDMTKGLMEIPKAGGGTETVIDRILRLLEETGAIEERREVLLCVGYKAELVMERYPECRFLKTYDPENPSDVLPAFLQVIEAFPEQNGIVFLMGDSVWSRKALTHFFSMSRKSPVVMYHGTQTGYTEIFGVAINGEDGKELIRKACAAETVPVVPGEIRWQMQGIKRISPRHCRASCWEQWIDLKRLPGKLRVYQAGPVDDIDWDADHLKVCNEIRAGVYDA